MRKILFALSVSVSLLAAMPLPPRLVIAVRDVMPVPQ